MSKADIKSIEQKLEQLSAFDGIVLAVWGMKPNYNKEKFVVNFDTKFAITENGLRETGLRFHETNL